MLSYYGIASKQSYMRPGAVRDVPVGEVFSSLGYAVDMAPKTLWQKTFTPPPEWVEKCIAYWPNANAFTWDDVLQNKVLVSFPTLDTKEKWIMKRRPSPWEMLSADDSLLNVLF